MTDFPAALDLASENWAMVELFRAQYGDLPSANDERKIDYQVATKNMANLVYHGKVSTFSAASVIAHLGRLISCGKNAQSVTEPDTQE